MLIEYTAEDYVDEKIEVEFETLKPILIKHGMPKCYNENGHTRWCWENPNLVACAIFELSSEDPGDYDEPIHEGHSHLGGTEIYIDGCFRGRFDVFCELIQHKIFTGVRTYDEN